MPHRRLFVGLALTDREREALKRQQEGLDGVRWVPPGNFHVTLVFLGAVDEARLSLVHEQLAAVRQPSFTRRLGDFGFGNRGGVLWVNVLGDHAIHELRRGIASALGAPDEGRAYLPHVTLARVRKPVPEAALKEWLSRKITVVPEKTEGFSLFESVRTDGGSHYLPLSQYALH